MLCIYYSSNNHCGYSTILMTSLVYSSSNFKICMAVARSIRFDCSYLIIFMQIIVTISSTRASPYLSR